MISLASILNPAPPRPMMDSRSAADVDISSTSDPTGLPLTSSNAPGTPSSATTSQSVVDDIVARFQQQAADAKHIASRGCSMTVSREQSLALESRIGQRGQRQPLPSNPLPRRDHLPGQHQHHERHSSMIKQHHPSSRPQAGIMLPRKPSNSVTCSPSSSLSSNSNSSSTTAPPAQTSFAKGRPKGVVKFMPYENLDEAALQEVRQFHVHPFGEIQDGCRHIPYNSGKKDFYDKTGRESFEVFQYSFRIPDDENEYIVMWDYNVGLVRMTPFFKVCKYSKTTPAKMLNLNPGLRDITHSITGGSIMAQGYWMPFDCAKAICATFCYHIAGALIPLFGPQFPAECVPPNTSNHGRMVIDPGVVMASTREAEAFRQMYSAQTVTTARPHHYGGGDNLASYGDGRPMEREPLSHHLYRHSHQSKMLPAGSSLSSHSRSFPVGSAPTSAHRGPHTMSHGQYRDNAQRIYDFHQRQFPRTGMKKTLTIDASYGGSSPYGTDTKGSGPEMDERRSLPKSAPAYAPYLPSPGPGRPLAPIECPPSPPPTASSTSGWTAANHTSHSHYQHQKYSHTQPHDLPPVRQLDPRSVPGESASFYQDQSALSHGGADPWLSAVPGRQAHPSPGPGPQHHPRSSSPTSRYHANQHEQHPAYTAEQARERERTWAPRYCPTSPTPHTHSMPSSPYGHVRLEPLQMQLPPLPLPHLSSTSLVRVGSKRGADELVTADDVIIDAHPQHGSTPLYLRDRESPRAATSPAQGRGDEDAKSSESLTYKAARALSSSRRMFGGSISKPGETAEDKDDGDNDGSRREAEKAAALMLMNLSVRSPGREKTKTRGDGREAEEQVRPGTQAAAVMPMPGADERPSKRRRATSM